jgi:hypothetical protein
MEDDGIVIRSSRIEAVSFFVRFEIFTAETEEFCFLGYKKPVRTSQEIHYTSVREPSRLKLCKI